MNVSDRQPPLSEKLSLIRYRMKHEKLHFSDEIRVVPRWLLGTVVWLYVLAVVGVAMLVIAGAVPSPIGNPSRFEGALAAALIVGGMGAAIGIVLLLIGYVNKDAERRGMNPGLWTVLVTILLPAWVLTGFVIYFLVREPLPFHCPRCGRNVSARFNYCPGCKYNLKPTCPQCKHEVGDTDRYCVRCGNELTPEIERDRPREVSGEVRG